MSGTIVQGALRSPETTRKAPRPATRHVPGILGGVLFTLRTWQRRHTERAHLAGLDRRLVADMGMTEHDVACEVAKPFWKG